MKKDKIITGRSNCVIYALQMWRKNGGYIVLRKTHYNRFGWLIWFHVLWMPADCSKEGMKSFVPIKPLIRTIPPFLFDGKIQDGD